MTCNPSRAGFLRARQSEPSTKMVRLCFGAVKICCFHAPDPNQGFLRLYSEKVVPKLRAAFG
jgi:hypothetical protein